MTKKKGICHYELLCLIDKKEKNKDKYEKLINNLQAAVNDQKLEKVEEKDWKPAYKINQLIEPTYLLIYFSAARKQVKELEKNILQTTDKDFLNRYQLLNLVNEKRNKIKLKIKDAKQD